MVKKNQSSDWLFFNVCLDLLLFMNVEVQNVKHMNEKKWQKKKIIILRQNKAKEVVLTVLVFCNYE